MSNQDISDTFSNPTGLINRWRYKRKYKQIIKYRKYLESKGYEIIDKIDPDQNIVEFDLINKEGDKHNFITRRRIKKKWKKLQKNRKWLRKRGYEVVTIVDDNTVEWELVSRDNDPEVNQRYIYDSSMYAKGGLYIRGIAQPVNLVNLDIDDEKQEKAIRKEQELLNQNPNEKPELSIIFSERARTMLNIDAENKIAGAESDGMSNETKQALALIGGIVVLIQSLQFIMG